MAREVHGRSTKSIDFLAGNVTLTYNGTDEKVFASISNIRAQRNTDEFLVLTLSETPKQSFERW